MSNGDPRSLAVLITLIALIGCTIPPASQVVPVDEAIQQQIRRVETSLPPVAKNGRTIDLSLQEWMEALGVPGASIAVIDDYEIVWAKGYGVIEAGATNAPVTPETVFQAASISKAITALAVLRHVEQGTFDLDTDINAYLRSWRLPGVNLPGTENVTLRHLLAHTAGITPGGFAGYERDAPVPSITQILEGEPPATNQAARANSVPGSSVSYSGLGYTIIELALTDRLDKPFEEIVKEAVLDPIGMHHSAFNQILPDALSMQAARGHRSTGRAIARGWYVYPELAAAGLWTTPSDLALLAIEVAMSRSGGSSRILSSAMTRQMLMQHKGEMALGFVIRPGDEHGYFAHSGGNQGYRCHLEMLSDSGKGVVVMTNSDAGQLLVALLVRSVAQSFDWLTYKRQPVSGGLADGIFAQLDRSESERRAIDIDDRILARHAGRYELSPGLVFEVTHMAGHLEVRLGDQPRFPVYPESDSKFFYQVVDAQITFVRNAAGETVSLVLHQGGRDQEAKRIE